MATPKTTQAFSEAEYLAMERAAGFKSEYLGGEIFAMAGGSPMHSLIATNIAGEMRNRLRGKSCVPFNSDLRLKVMASGLYTYPDLSVICGPLEFSDAHRDTVINPTLLAEVLSDSTESYDRGTKFTHYRRIASLREYLLISQKEPIIEQYVRAADGVWHLREVVGLDAQLQLPALEIVIALGEVFSNVKFEASSLRVSTQRPG